MNDKELIRLCFTIAEGAKENADGPFGSVITNEEGQIIAKAGNTTSSKNSVIYHAEMNAIEQAESVRGKGNLEGCTLYSSAEPCPMCASAIVWCGLKRVVFGASIKALQKRGVHQIEINCRDIFRKSGSSMEVLGPVLEDEGLNLFN